jgi:hypothetical protein
MRWRKRGGARTTRNAGGGWDIQNKTGKGRRDAVKNQKDKKLWISV